MNKPPAFQFYAKDWLSSKSVLRMTPSQCGYFINLLAHSWDNDPPGTLPNDPDFLWKMARAESKEKFESECSLVLDQFPVEKSGRKRSVLRFNPKLRSYYRAFCTQSKQKSEAAKARWDKKLQASAFSPQCPASASSSASASASATSTTKKPSSSVNKSAAEKNGNGLFNEIKGKLFQAFELAFGQKPSWGGKDYKALHTLTKIRPDLEVEEIGRRYCIMLASEDHFIRQQGGSLLFFATNFDRFIKEENGNGRYRTKAERIESGNKAAFAEALRRAEERDRQEALRGGVGNG